MSQQQPSIGFAIITLNEASHIRKCIQSVPAGIPIVVVDSGSVDATREIAAAMGAKVIQRAFQDYSDQKNHAASLLGTDWVFSLDADETLSPGLLRLFNGRGADSILGDCWAVRVERRLHFMGRTLRFGRSRDYPVRLYRPDQARFVGAIHEQVRPLRGTDGPDWPRGKIKTITAGFLLHESYDDLEDYFQKFNRYTTAMAEQRSADPASLNLTATVFRPWWEFFSRYFIKGGILDGFPGYTYALISSLYAFTKYAKAIESGRRGRKPA